MSKENAIKQFKRVYPEREITCSVSEINEEYFLIDANFPDGNFYFVVSKNTVSHSYNSATDAINSIK